MKKIIIYILMFMFLILGCGKKEPIGDSSVENVNKINIAVEKSTKNHKNIEYEIVMKRDILSLVMAYPEYVKGVERDNEGKVYILMKSGKKILYDDKREKTFQEKMQNPDIQDMLEQIYPLSDIKTLMDKDFDPGRIRNYQLLKEVYGGGKGEIQGNLVNVKILYKNCQFNKNNGAASSLEKAMEEVSTLIQSKANIASFVYPPSGTFNYRVISGTSQLSAHAFGIAIDLRSDKKDYWKWATREQGQKRIDKYPQELVRAFENNNFVWGGKWNHFDILHFEYRPEIIIKSRYFADKPGNNEKWYDGAPVNDEKVFEYIRLIDESIG